MKVVGLLFGNLVLDSRAKRAFTSAASGRDFSAYVLNCDQPDMFSYPVSSPSFKRRGRLYGVLWVFKAFFYLLSIRPNVVYAEGLLTLIPASLFKFFFKTEIIYDSREIVFGDKSNSSTYSAVHQFVEKSLIGYAGIVFTANEQRAKLLKEYYGLDKVVSWLLNIPPQKPEMRRALENMERSIEVVGKTIVYQGTLNTFRGLDRLLPAISKHVEDCRLLFIVEGRAVPKLRKLLSELGLNERSKVMPFVSHDELYDILTKCHLGVVCYELEGLNNIYCAPNKLYEYAQCHLPMITSPQEIFRKSFAENKMGFAISAEDWTSRNEKGIGETVKRALEYSYLREDFDTFNERHRWEVEAKKIGAVIEKVVERKKE